MIYMTRMRNMFYVLETTNVKPFNAALNAMKIMKLGYKICGCLLLTETQFTKKIKLKVQKRRYTTQFHWLFKAKKLHPGLPVVCIYSFSIVSCNMSCSILET